MTYRLKIEYNTAKGQHPVTVSLYQRGNKEPVYEVSDSSLLACMKAVDAYIKRY